MITPSSASAVLLPAIFGDDHAASAPDDWDVVLFDGDPRLTGDELAATGGYERATAPNTDAVWDLDGGVVYSSPVTFAESTAAWPNDATHLALAHPSHPNKWVAPQELSEPIVVDAAGLSAVVRIRALFADLDDLT